MFEIKWEKETSHGTHMTWPRRRRILNQTKNGQKSPSQKGFG